MNGPEHFDKGEEILKEAAGEDAPEWMIARSQLAAAHFTAVQAAAALNDNHAHQLLSLDAAAAWQRSQDPATPTPPPAIHPATERATEQAVRELAKKLEPYCGARVELRGEDGRVLARGVLGDVTASKALFGLAHIEAGCPSVPLAEISSVVPILDPADTTPSVPWVSLPREEALSLIGPVGWSRHGWTVVANTHLSNNGDTSSHELVIFDGVGHFKAEYDKPLDPDAEPCAWAEDEMVVFEAARKTTHLKVITGYELIHPSAFTAGGDRG